MPKESAARKTGSAGSAPPCSRWLGEDDKAMELLEDSQRMKQFARWWYTGELDPLYAHLHSDPRFKALVARAKQHRAQQRALLEEMRNKGVVPRRTG